MTQRDYDLISAMVRLNVARRELAGVYKVVPPDEVSAVMDTLTRWMRRLEMTAPLPEQPTMPLSDPTSEAQMQLVRRPDGVAIELRFDGDLPPMSRRELVRHVDELLERALCPLLGMDAMDVLIAQLEGYQA